MTVSFERSESQYIDAYIEYGKASPAGRRDRRNFLLRLSFGASVLVTAFTGAVLSLLGTAAMWFPLPLLFVFAWPFYFAAFSLQYRRIVTRVFRKAMRAPGLPAFGGTMTVHVNAEGIRTTSPSTDALRRWETVMEIVEGQRFLVLNFPEGILEIPRAAFGSPSGSEDFVRCVNARGASGAHSSPPASWYRSKDLTDAQQSQRRGE